MNPNINGHISSTFAIITIILLILAVSAAFISLKSLDLGNKRLNEVYVGVEVAYGGFDEAKIVVDRVRNYTNLFVISSLNVTQNRALLDEVCDYVYEAGLHFIVQLTSPIKYSYNACKWIVQATEKYQDKFLGIYYFDEPGGKQLDKEGSKFVIEAENFTDAAATYVGYLYAHAKSYMDTGVRTFTSDYALYWFDYEAGYDVILTEFGWNHSRPLHVALCRGAAAAHNKDWGVIITWKYWKPPYIESGGQLLNDMVLAYHAGAKYIVIFNYGERKISEYGILRDEHFKAIEEFWKYVKAHPEKHGAKKAEAAYILPKGYGFGFRRVNDTIWGLWKPDDKAEKIWNCINTLLEKYNLGLDIIYENEKTIAEIEDKYLKLIFWNETYNG